jgi:tryptophanyl-tRNA synthetase
MEVEGPVIVTGIKPTGRVHPGNYLAWILACSAPKGLLNRAHAYRAAAEVKRVLMRVGRARGLSA